MKGLRSQDRQFGEQFALTKQAVPSFTEPNIVLCNPEPLRLATKISHIHLIPWIGPGGSILYIMAEMSFISAKIHVQTVCKFSISAALMTDCCYI